MANLKYDKEITALLVIDPYNDFISEGGKLWDRVKGVAEANQCVPHMVQVLDAARRLQMRKRPNADPMPPSFCVAICLRIVEPSDK